MIGGAGLGVANVRSPRLSITPTPIDGIVIVETRRHTDNRGAFLRAYCEQELESVLETRRVVQINHSRTVTPGAVRGMHFQYPPHAEMKFIRCLRGRVWDIAVDLRRGSPTFLRWYALELSPENARMLVVPEGCAHGFQALEADSELLYLHTAFYAPEAEGGVSCLDPRLAISWPMPPTDLSARDRSFAQLTPDFEGIAL